MYKYRMPATRPERRDNPLRILRQILGENGKPMHQEEFAVRVGVPVATLRSIEAGRRPMTESNCLKQIFVTLKAAWNEREGKWKIFGSKWDYEKRHADLFREFDPEDPWVDDHTLHRLVERLFDLFAAATREQRAALILYLSDHLAELAATNFGLKVNLKPTEPEWYNSMGNTMVWGKELDKAAVFTPRYRDPQGQWRVISPHQDDGGIFDFRARRTFKAEDYPAKTTEEADAMAEARSRAKKDTKVQETQSFSRTAPKQKNRSE
jgi:hypothetical protein